MTRPINFALLTGWRRHPGGLFMVLLVLVLLIGVQAGLAKHAWEHSSCSAAPADSQSDCAICSAAANLSATIILIQLPGNVVFSGFLVLLPLLPLFGIHPVQLSARGPPPAVV